MNASISTGHGLKDPGTAVGQFTRILTAPPETRAVAKVLGLKGR